MCSGARGMTDHPDKRRRCVLASSRDFIQKPCQSGP
jgi:hypothetical protein